MCFSECVCVLCCQELEKFSFFTGAHTFISHMQRSVYKSTNETIVQPHGDSLNGVGTVGPPSKVAVADSSQSDSHQQNHRLWIIR